MIPLLLATVLFTNPSHDAAGPHDSLACAESATPITDLALVRLYGQRRGAPRPRLLAFKTETVAGMSDSVAFADSEAVWTVWATFVDASGNESCESNRVGVNLTLSVPEDLPSGQPKLYDVAGRRVDNPAPGVYFTRGRRRIVVVK